MSFVLPLPGGRVSISCPAFAGNNGFNFFLKGSASPAIILDRLHFLFPVKPGIAKMTDANPEAVFASTTNSILVPNEDTDIHKAIPRWSDERLKKPAIIVTPSTQDDIIAAVHYARENGLILLAGSGGHKIVPINEKTLYLDMRNFKGIKVDKDNGTVEIGGAVTNAELMMALLQNGYYTSTFKALTVCYSVTHQIY